jgi:hypothetical protein
MRMKAIKTALGAARWIGRILKARLPMSVVYGLRTR